MKEKYEKMERKVRFNRHEIIITTYYLWNHKAGLRIEVRRFSRTQTVEIELLLGDDVLVLKKIHKREVLKNPSKKEIDKVVERFIDYACELNLLAKNYAWE